MPDYGYAHQRERERWRIIIASQGALCVRCHRPITGAWDLDHADDGITYLGPACTTCNRSAGGRKGRRNDRLKRIRTRNW